ncbi:MAG: hypothetical protein GY928_04915 [Colwellia sp.]|nr:hypothetical protein [Colwellia sp.]
MQVIKAETQTAFVHNQNTEIARNLDNSNDLFNHIDGAVARLASTFPTTMSPEEAAKKTLETEKGIVEAYINGQIDQRPGEGWPDFRDNKMLRAYFNDDERIKFENSFAEAITGVKKMEDIGLLKGHFEGLDQLILDGSLAGDVDNFLTFKNNILSAPGGAEKLGPDFMQDLERLITASRKQTALSSNRDPILGTKLTEERGRIMNYRDEDNGEIENVESFLQAANGYLMRMKRHEAEGDIKNEFYQKQIAPIRSAMIEIFENQKLPYRGLFGNKEVDAFHARPEKIQDELSKYDLLPEEKKTLQGEILFDLNEKLYKLEKEANREFTVEEEYDLFKIIMDGYLAPFKKTAFADDTVFYDTQTGEQFMYTAKGRVRTV